MNEIINTLIIRDIKSRFSGETTSYIWGFINPLVWIVALIIFFSVVGKQVPIFTDIISFLIPGMLSYIVFRNTINSVMRTRKTSLSMLHIPSIHPNMVRLAAGLTELLNGTVVYFVLIALNYIIFDKVECHDLLIMMFGYFCAWATGLAIGNFAAELTNLYPIVEKMLPMILRPVFWISGVFYTANELPEWLSQIAALNPLFQSIEIVRDGTFLSYNSRIVVYYQPLLFVAIVMGLTFFIKLKEKKTDLI